MPEISTIPQETHPPQPDAPSLPSPDLNAATVLDKAAATDSTADAHQQFREQEEGEVAIPDEPTTHPESEPDEPNAFAADIAAGMARLREEAQAAVEAARTDTTADPKEPVASHPTDRDQDKPTPPHDSDPEETILPHPTRPRLEPPAEQDNQDKPGQKPSLAQALAGLAILTMGEETKPVPPPTEHQAPPVTTDQTVGEVPAAQPELKATHPTDPDTSPPNEPTPDQETPDTPPTPPETHDQEPQRPTNDEQGEAGAAADAAAPPPTAAGDSGGGGDEPPVEVRTGGDEPEEGDEPRPLDESEQGSAETSSELVKVPRYTVKRNYVKEAVEDPSRDMEQEVGDSLDAMRPFAEVPELPKTAERRAQLAALRHATAAYARDLGVDVSERLPADEQIHTYDALGYEELRTRNQWSKKQSGATFLNGEMVMEEEVSPANTLETVGHELGHSTAYTGMLLRKEGENCAVEISRRGYDRSDMRNERGAEYHFEAIDEALGEMRHRETKERYWPQYPALAEFVNGADRVNYPRLVPLFDQIFTGAAERLGRPVEEIRRNLQRGQIIGDMRELNVLAQAYGKKGFKAIASYEATADEEAGHRLLRTLGLEGADADGGNS